MTKPSKPVILPTSEIESFVEEQKRPERKRTPIRKKLAEKAPNEKIGYLNKPSIKSFRDLENNVKA